MIPTFSIIVPTYNQAKYIGAALDSILAQSYSGWEAIVINDGSTDDTAVIIENYAARDSRIRVFHQANGGVAAALNRGLSEARGTWINWLSSDDMFEPNKLQVNYNWIKRYPECNFFFSYFSILWESTGKLTKHDLWGPLPKPEYQILTLFYRNYLSGITICIRRKSWEKVGQFDIILRYGQDYDQWLRLLRHNRAIFIPEWLVINRNHAEQGSEVFPEACYYDTARAAIRFINETKFIDLVPFADLSDPTVVLDTVRITLEISCDPTSFLYALGPHPALILRLLEWLTSDCFQNKGLQENLRKEVGDFLVTMALSKDNRSWGWMWRSIAAAWENRRSPFLYSSIDPGLLGRRELISRESGSNSGPVLPLKEYLIQFFGQPDLDPIETPLFSIAILCRDSSCNIDILKKKSLQLSLSGHQVLLIAKNNTPYEWNQGAPVVACDKADRDQLPWIGRVDFCFVCDGQGETVWLEAAHWVTLSNRIADDICREIDLVLLDMSRPSNSAAIDVVFLERVLSGGGAEKVVMDIVQNLDRRKFKVSVVTLFEGPSGSDLPPDVSFRCLRPAIGPNPQDTEGDGTGAIVISHWIARFLKRVYHRATTERMRERFQIANRLHLFYNVIKGGRGFLRQFLYISPAVVLSKSNSLIQSFFAAAKHSEAENSPAVKISSGSDEKGYSKRDFLARHDIFFYALGSPWNASYDMSEFLGNRSNDVVLISVMEEAAAVAWLSQIYSPKLRHIAWFHTLESAYIPEMYPEPARCEAERWILSNAARNASHVVFPSQGCRTDLIGSFRVDGASIGVIPNSINVARIKRLSRAPSPVDGSAKNSKRFRFVCVARLAAEKNHALLIKACCILKERSFPFEMVLVGGGPLENEIEDMICDHNLEGQFRLLGSVDNPYPVMASSDALVLSSNYEAFGIVLIEAMVCGIPVIATDCPFGPREVLDKGRCGLLVPPEDPARLALAMQELMKDDDLRIKMIESGYERIKTFDIRCITQQWEKLIENQF
ncbi:MAG: glycosyltransferase [Desulfobacula sp.]|nr:glycosyltransferase [Desulfobacula sp.]